MYLGGMIDRNDEVYVIEFNARWGDPEAQVIIPGIKNDFYRMSMDVVEHGLQDLSIINDDKYRVVVTGAARGYPGDYSSVIGKEVFGIRLAQQNPNVRIYPAGVKENNGHHFVIFLCCKSYGFPPMGRVFGNCPINCFYIWDM